MHRFEWSRIRYSQGVAMSASKDGHDEAFAQKFARDGFTLYYPLVTELQAAIKAAKEAGDPLADACGGPDTESTLKELIAHFERCADPKRRREDPEDSPHSRAIRRPNATQTKIGIHWPREYFDALEGI
jgi:hypothetical protein